MQQIRDGSLALTASGHGTIDIVRKALQCEDVRFDLDFDTPENIMDLTGYSKDHVYETWHGLSLGGGDVSIVEYDIGDDAEIYPEENFSQIRQIVEKEGIDLTEYVYRKEEDLKDL